MNEEPACEDLACKIAEHIKQLPPIPENIGKILQLASSEGKDDEKLKEIIKTDPGLCAELLHLAACFTDCTRQSPAETIDEAISQAGLDYLVDLVASSYLKRNIKHQFNSMQRLDEFFQHSREIAATCPILADVIGLPHRQRQFYEMAGLLHDIGRLVIRFAVYQEDACLLGTDIREMTSITDYENQVMGLNHCQVGEQICRKWGLAEKLREGVERHHTPLLDHNDFSFPGGLLFLAHFVAGSDFTGQIISKLIPSELFAKMHLNAELFDEARRRYRKQTQVA